ncbi:ceramide kinase-like isoform X2 [Tubulanus polymorphus]|uniref:ceramide kinase-like isoform X2 n=1 Tax=Tubulanus polymorphus TaxID=672921 RepID=UPI003DA66444
MLASTVRRLGLIVRKCDVRGCSINTCQNNHPKIKDGSGGMASSAMTVGMLLQSNLEINNRTFLVTLTPSTVYWDVPHSATGYNTPTATDPVLKHDVHTVDLREVVYVASEPKHQGHRDSKGNEMTSLQSNVFSLWVLKRMPKHKWRDRKITFSCRDALTCQLWIKKIQDRLNSNEFRRPKSLLVFINPYSGKRLGPKIYDEKIAPLLKHAGIHTEVIETVRANHARDTIMEYNLSKIDGVVFVGGDGMFSEIMHGLMYRTQLDAGITDNAPNHQQNQPFIRIGNIPAGSTNTVAFSTMGTDDAITGALHIILGDHMAIDAFTVHHGNQFIKYGVSLMGYGYYGDVIQESEEFRWMGPKRYDYIGLKKFLSKKSYTGEVAFLPSTDLENHPRDGTRCMHNCYACHAASQQKFDYEADNKENTKFDTEGVSLLGGKDGWQRIRGRFIGINSYSMSCRCDLSPDGPSPSCHLGDGTVDLVIVHDCSRFDYFRHLMRTTRTGADQFDFNFIQVIRVKEYKFRPMSQDDDPVEQTDDEGQQRLQSGPRNSVWNCDGEVVDQPSVDVRAHCQLIPLFARGIEEQVSKKTCSFAECVICGKAKKMGIMRDYMI